MLSSVPARSVQCCVASPLYYNLRDYKVAALARGFAAVDAPVSGGIKPGNGIKTKDSPGITYIPAFALRANGWYLRSDVIWHKPNSMPENVRDPTYAYRHVLLLSRSPYYHFYGVEAIDKLSKYPSDHRALWVDTRKLVDPPCADNDNRSLRALKGARFGNLLRADDVLTPIGNVWAQGETSPIPAAGLLTPSRAHLARWVKRVSFREPQRAAQVVELGADLGALGCDPGGDLGTRHGGRVVAVAAVQVRVQHSHRLAVAKDIARARRARLIQGDAANPRLVRYRNHGTCRLQAAPSAPAAARH